MKNRECGTCTACCEGWLRADELEMKPGQPCRHCTQSGCAIYPDRPEDPCRRFACGWLQDADRFPDELRPDHSGVIVLLGRKWRNWQVIMGIPAGRKVPAESLDWLRLYAKQARLPLVFHERLVAAGEFTGVKARAYGSPAFANAVKYSIGPEDIVKM
jgi:hypothetical protein